MTPQAALTESLDRVRSRAARGGKCTMDHHTFLIFSMLAQDGVFVNPPAFSIMMR